MLGQAMAHIADVMDPEVFVIGGGVSRAGEILLNGVKKYYRETVFHASENTEIRWQSAEMMQGYTGQ